MNVELLQKIPYFATLNRDNPALLELARAVSCEQYERGQLLFLEGDACRGIYYLAEGQVRLFKSEPGGREQVLQLVRTGATFNEVPVLDNGPVAVNAEALEPSVVWIIPTSVVLRLLDREPMVARAILSNLAAELRQLTGLVAEISLKQVTARVARILLDQLQPDNILGRGISNEVTAELTQQQMAAMAGTVREMIGRALRTLQRAGAIEAHRGHIIIKDAARLRSFL